MPRTALVSISSPLDPTLRIPVRLGAALCAGLGLLLGGTPCTAQTPISSAGISPDVTVSVDGQTISDEDVAEQDASSGTITKAALGSLPPEADLSAVFTNGSGTYAFSLDITVTLPGGLTARPNDVVLYESGAYSIAFDGAANGIPDSAHVDAIAFDPVSKDLFLSFDVTVTLGASTFADEDLIRFDGSGPHTYFDGSAAGVDPALDLDGAHFLPYVDTLLLSFDGSGSVGGVAFDDEDVLEYDPSGPSWAMAWDTSVERPDWQAGADVDAIHFVPEPTTGAMLSCGALWLVALSGRRLRRR